MTNTTGAEAVETATDAPSIADQIVGGEAVDTALDYEKLIGMQSSVSISFESKFSSNSDMF